MENLIYNGDFSKGADSWGGNINVADGVLTATGNIFQDLEYLIPMSPGVSYTLSFDIMFTALPTTKHFYFALNPYDGEMKNIYSEAVLRTADSTRTTLAQPLTNGDTTVTLTNQSGWLANTDYRYIGICDNLDWGYTRCTKRYLIKQHGISGNVVTLANAYSGDTIPAGTKVANFTSGGMYIYPVLFSNTTVTLNTWMTKTARFTYNDEGANNRNAHLQFAQIRTLGYDMTYKLKNLKLIDSDGSQIATWDEKTDINKNGEVRSIFNEQDRSQAKNTRSNLFISKEFIEM